MNKGNLIKCLERAIEVGKNNKAGVAYIAGYTQAKDDVMDLLDNEPPYPSISQWMADIIESDEHENPIEKLNEIVTGYQHSIDITSQSERFKKYLEDEEIEDFYQVMKMLMHVIATGDYEVKSEPVIKVSIEYKGKEKKMEISNNTSFSKLLSILESVK